MVRKTSDISNFYYSYSRNALSIRSSPILESIDHALKIDLHTLYRVNNPHEKTFPAPQGVHRCGGLEMEVDSPPAARREARREPPDSPQGPTHTAIKEVEGFLKGRGLLERIGNAWGHVKTAALKGVEP